MITHCHCILTVAHYLLSTAHRSYNVFGGTLNLAQSINHIGLILHSVKMIS